MIEHLFFLVAIGGSPAGEGESQPFFFLPLAFLAIIYFVMLRPMQTKQKKLDALVSGLKPKDRVIINPGIYAEVVSLEEGTLLVRVDANTKIRVLKSAVAGLQDQTSETENK
jgi:preprotein translocase subunit YajC